VFLQDFVLVRNSRVTLYRHQLLIVLKKSKKKIHPGPVGSFEPPHPKIIGSPTHFYPVFAVVHASFMLLKPQILPIAVMYQNEKEDKGKVPEVVKGESKKQGKNQSLRYTLDPVEGSMGMGV
jgi:hypothetical protein